MVWVGPPAGGIGAGLQRVEPEPTSEPVRARALGWAKPTQSSPPCLGASCAAASRPARPRPDPSVVRALLAPSRLRMVSDWCPRRWRLAAPNERKVSDGTRTQDRLDHNQGPGVSWDRIRLYKAKSVRLDRLSFAQIGSSLVARSGADAHPEAGPHRQTSAPRVRREGRRLLSSGVSPTAPFVEKQGSQPRHLLLVPSRSRSSVGETAASRQRGLSAFARRHVNGAALMGRSTLLAGRQRSRSSSKATVSAPEVRTSASASRRQRWCSTSIRSAAHARPHCAYARDATRPAKWRFRGSSPSEHLVGTALGRPH